MLGAKVARLAESGRRPPLRRRIVLALGVGIAAPGMSGPPDQAQRYAAAPVPPEQIPRYAAAQLECAGFRERSRSQVETYVGGRTRRESVAIDGDWRFRARPGPGDSVALEGWFDTLAVWRRSEDDTLAPDTDGLIGGRYRGRLSSDGRYRPDVRPFVPDPLLEVADLSRALEDLLPRLAPRGLAVGETWADGAGFEIRRLADSGEAGSERFRLTVSRELSEISLRGDSLPLKLRQSIREDGTFAWQASEGLISRDRHIVVETYVPAEARVRRPVQARLEQRITLQRLPRACPTDTAG
jgi:hypothetical protein